MADQELKELPEEIAPASDALVYVVNDPGGTPADRKVQLANLPKGLAHNVMASLQGGTTDEYYHLLEAEYTELSEWLDNVTLGSNGVTTVPQLVLTPSAVALSDVIGGMYFSNIDKSIYVCTEL